MGRPRRYTAAVADRICDRLLEGRSLKSICQDAGMPAASTVFRWLAEDLVFARRFPMMMGADGFLYEHESGWNYGGQTPYAVSGPVTLGQGDRMMEVQGLVPDDITEGDVTATFTVRDYPDAAQRDFGPYSLTSPTDLLFQGRHVKVRFDGAVSADWRVGEAMLDAVQGDGV